MVGIIDTLTNDEQLQLIYIGYFDRAADGQGFDFWEAQYVQALANGQSPAEALTNIANAFAPQSETAAIYPTLVSNLGSFDPTSAQTQIEISNLVDAIYLNLFGRLPDAAGEAYWENELLSGNVELGAAVLAIANGATGTDALVLQNKIDAAEDFTNSTTAAGLGFPPDAEFLAAAKAVLDGVTDDPATVAAAAAFTDAFVAAANDDTVSLTTGADTGAAFSLGLGNDTFNAFLVQTALIANQTLTNNDSLDGGVGTDTLNAELVNILTTPASLKSIEVVNITTPGAILGFPLVPVTLDVVNADSINTLGFNGLTVDVAVLNLKTSLDAINITNTGFITGVDIDILQFAGSVDAPDDAVTVTLNNSFDTELTIDDGYETVTINSVGGAPNELELNGAPSTINVTGDTDLDLDIGDAFDVSTLDLLDATTFTGNLDAEFEGTGDVTVNGGSGDDDLDFDDVTGAVTVNGNGGNDFVLLGTNVDATATGGDGDDEFLFRGIAAGGPTFNTDDSVDGGAGTDILTIETDDGETLLAGVGAGIVAIERIVHTHNDANTNGDTSTNFAESGSAAEIELAANYNGNNHTVTNISNTDKVIYSGVNLNDLSLLQDADDILDQINLELVGGVVIGNELDVGIDVEALFLTSTGPGTNVITDASEIDTSISVSGDGNIVIGGAGGDSYDFGGGIVNASALTGDLTITLGAGDQTVTGGSGDDTILNIGPDDQIGLSAGGSDTVNFTQITNGGGSALNLNNDFAKIFGFEVANDTAQVDISALALTEGNGSPADAADGVVVQDVAANGLFNITTTDVNFLKFGSVAAAADAQTGFNAAIGGGSVTYTDTAGSDFFLASFYDVANGQAVLFTVDGGGGVVNTGDDVEVVGLIQMSAADYANFGADGLTLVA